MIVTVDNYRTVDMMNENKTDLTAVRRHNVDRVLRQTPAAATPTCRRECRHVATAVTLSDVAGVSWTANITVLVTHREFLTFHLKICFRKVVKI